MQPAAGAHLRHDDSVVVEDVDDDVCLFRPGSNDVAVLNRTAAEIWTLVDGKTSAERIAAELADRYEQDPDTVLGEVERVLADLAERGFLVSA